MNKKGFTLAELLAVIVIIAIISTIGYTSVSNSIEKSKEKSFEIAKKSIKEAAIQCYKEIDDKNIEIPNKNISSSNYLTIEVQDLINYGFLSNEKNKLIEPKTGEEINDCTITIRKRTVSNKTTYTVYYAESETNKCSYALND